MKRRGITVLVGAIAVALLTWQALSMDVAYVALGPGPTQDTLGSYSYEGEEYAIVTADSEHASDSAGQLRLTTVRIHDHIELGQALRYWLDDEYAVVPRDIVYPPDRTTEEIQQEQAEQWQQSQSSAETAALTMLGHPVQVTVIEAGETELRTDDVITAVADEPVSTVGEFAAAISAVQAGAEVPLTVDRDGTERDIDVATAANGDGVALPGVEVTGEQDDPYGVEIDTQYLDIAGPSAGLMFALAVVDRVDPDDLTGGMIIAGTGEIDDAGNVGPIGGVEQKVIGAREAGATVFLTPADNCAAAAANAPEGLTLVRVDTLDDAVSSLSALRSGQPAPSC